MERIEVKDVESFRVAALRIKASRSEEEEYFEQLSRWLKKRDVKPRKKLAIFYDKVYDFDRNVLTYEVCFEIKETVEKQEGVQIKELPQQRVATIIHHGSCEKIFSTYETLLEWIKNEGYVVKGPSREVYVASSEDKSGLRHCLTEIQFPIRQNLTQKLFAVVENWMFPHFFVAFQWAFLIFAHARQMSFFNFPIVIPGSRANGGLKVVTASHLWVLLFSIILCFLFYKHRRKGVAEKGIFGVSMVAALFSVAHFILRFVNDFLLLMWITEIIAWVFYLLVFATSVYTILVALLTSVLRGVMKGEENDS